VVAVSPCCARYAPAVTAPVVGDYVEADAEVFLLFSEPDHPVEGARLLAERGWDGQAAPRVIRSTVERGRNLIHDGPSFLETTRWLRGELLG